MNTTVRIVSAHGTGTQTIDMVSGVYSHATALEAGRMWLTKNPDWVEEDFDKNGPVVYLPQSDSFMFCVKPATGDDYEPA